jgi:hypothetical protein
MRKLIFLFLLLGAMSITKPVRAQEMGVSFSFFFPKSGYFSAPISPFSLRGLGFNLTRNLALESGFSLYRMSGMSVTGMDFSSQDPFVGPFFNLMVPAELILQFGTEELEFRFKGGGFAFYNFGTKLNYGNIDRAAREHFNWQAANADLKFDNNIGYGYEFGFEIVSYLTRQFGISLGANYYIGGSKMNLRGSITGGSETVSVKTVAVNYPGSKLDYTGLELSIGVIFSGG